MKQFRTGLVVGKFAPLHLGHQLVIDTALSQCDHVVLISWSVPEFPGCEPSTRAEWLAELYPQTTWLVVNQDWLTAWSVEHSLDAPVLPSNDDPDVVHRRFVGWLCTHVLDVVVDAVFTSDDYGPGFAAELEQWFLEHGIADNTVTHVCVDRLREIVPTSGTKIRGAFGTSKQWLSPVVAASFVRRVTILGGESSGKSTLAAALAEHYNTEWVPEYGRELWDLRNGVLSYADLLLIATEQVRRETQAARMPRSIESGILICDTSPLTTLLYCLDMFNQAEPELHALATRTYDIVVLCSPDFDFVQDGTRRDDTFRRAQHTWYEKELALRCSPYTVASGPIKDRIHKVSSTQSKLSSPI